MKLHTISLILTTVPFLSCTSTHAYPSQPAFDFDWGTLSCPPPSSNKTLPTPTYGFSQRLWTICAELVIHAPPHIVYNTLIDFESYHRWNNFVTKVFDFPSNVTETPRDVYVGMPMSFTVAGLPTDDAPTSESEEVVTILQPKPDPNLDSGYLMNAWRSDTYFDLVRGGQELVKAEHPNILTPIKGGRGGSGEEWTRYVSYETYYEGESSEGIFALRGRLQELFERQGRELKAYIEKKSHST